MSAHGFQGGWKIDREKQLLCVVVINGVTLYARGQVIRDLEDVGAACKAYRQLGLRATVAPMLGDLARTNYVSLVLNAADRNATAKAEGKTVGGLEADGSLREGWPEENVSQQLTPNLPPIAAPHPFQPRFVCSLQRLHAYLSCGRMP